MSLALVSIMLALSSAEPPPAVPPPPDSTFTSTKTLATLQQCLTDKLAMIGEVVALKTEGNSTTLLVLTHQAVFFEGADGPKLRQAGWRALLDRLEPVV